MRKFSFLIFLVLVFSAAHVSAEVMHYSKCKLAAGKTIADVQTWAKNWRALLGPAGINYRIRVLLAHADSDSAADEFFLEGASDTLVTHAEAYTWWYSDPAAAKSAAELNAAASCDSGSIYRTAGAG